MIVCLVANPSIDKLFEVERLVRGDIHRPLGFEQTAGGKGLNVARAVSALDGDVRAVALFRGTRASGSRRRSRPRACTARSCGRRRDRSSLSVADRETGGLTEFYEHGSEVPSSAWPELANATAALFGETTWLTISGSVPVGIDDSAYRDLVSEARAAGVRERWTPRASGFVWRWRRSRTSSRSTRRRPPSSWGPDRTSRRGDGCRAEAA